MAITAPTGLSTAQKDRLERFDPTMDGTNAIPATIASKTDVSTVISDLASTSAGKGASCIGIQDAGTLITATTVEGALAELAAASGGAPAAHAASHTDGTDDIQNATAAQKGLATAAQITKLDGIEALADVTDDANVRAALAAATAAVNFNAQNITNVGTVDGRNVSADGLIVDAASAELSPIASSNVGMIRHVKITTPGGVTANTDKALAPGTWEVVDVWSVNKGGGAAGDTAQLLKSTGGAITEAFSVNVVDKTVVRVGEIDDANNTLVGGTDSLRVTETDGGAGAPALDVHVLLRLVA